MYYCHIISPCVNDDVTRKDATQVGSDLLSDACGDLLWEIPFGCIIQQYSVPLPGKKGTLEYLKDGFDFLFTCMVVDGREGGNRDSASRWSLDGHQGNLPRFATVRDFLAVSLGGRFGKVCYFERLLTATMC